MVNGMGDSRIFAIANQKGGVGKTTTAINLGTALASVGRRVLIVDLDPQGNASTGLGVDLSKRLSSSYDVLIEGTRVSDVARPVENIERLSVLPATQELSGVDGELLDEDDGRIRLRNALRAASEETQNFDYVLIDCPPSLNLLTVNALAASTGVIVPLQCEFFALEGLSQLLHTIQRIKKNLNPEIKVQGVVLTMFDNRVRSCAEVADDAREFLGGLVFDTVVPRNVKLSEAPSFGVPALVYDHLCPGSQAYIRLATEVLERESDRLSA